MPEWAARLGATPGPTPLRACVSRALGLTTLALLGWLFGFAAGCNDLRCEGGKFIIYGKKPLEGSLVAEDLWESTPTDGEWLDFGHKNTIVFDLRDQVGGRQVVRVVPDISSARRQNQPFASFTPASGNVALIQVFQPGQFQVFNDTCDDLFLRVTADLAPLPASPAADANSGADAGGVNDANRDADAGSVPDAAASNGDGGAEGADAAADSSSDAGSEG